MGTVKLNVVLSTTVVEDEVTNVAGSEGVEDRP